MRLKNKTIHRTLFPVMAGLLTAMVIFSAVMFIIYSEHQQKKQEERIYILNQMSTARARLEGALNSRLLLVKSIVSYIAMNTNIDKETFQSFAEGLAGKDPVIRNISLLKNTTIIYTYPARGNEKAIGVDLLKIPAQKSTVQKAMDTRQAVIAGPVDLVQGGVGIIHRIPIFTTPRGKPMGSGAYWGQASVVIMQDVLFKEVGILDDLSIKYAFRGKDGLGAKGDIFLGDETVFRSNPVIMDIILSSGSWQMAAIPSGGWGSKGLLSSWLYIIGIVLSLLAGVMVWSLMKTKEILQQQLILQRESEEKYRNIFENAIEGIFQSTAEGRFLNVNPTMARIYAFKSPEEMIEHYTDISSQLYIDANQRLEFQRRLAEEGVLEKFETQHYRKDNSKIWVSVNARIIRDAEGKILYYEGLTEDITERKRDEEEKKILEERLQRAEKMEALGTLAGGVAHDLNNVLGIIIGYSEMLLYDIEAASPLRPGLVNILEGSQKAAAIVQDLLTLTRRGVAARKVLNLNRVVVDCQRSPEFVKLTSYHPLIKTKFDLEQDLLNISGSSVHLDKTLFNLISNACEAMPKGGKLVIQTSNQYLDRPVQGYDEIREGDYVVLSITDTGEGISATDLKRVFEPFYTKKIMGRSGTGLGLAVVWGTVKDHHGYINVQSQEGNGSTFKLYFPVIRENVTPEEKAVALSEYLGKGQSILVVDDVQGQRDLAEEMLNKLNYRVTSVSSGEEAVSYLKGHPVDLLVLDMIMDPGMDGLDTYKKILEIHPRQRAIIVSGFSESDRVHTAQNLGAGAYVKKPYVLEKLGLAVRLELDK